MVAKLDMTKAFDNTDLNFAEEAAQHFAGAGLAHALVQEHREGRLAL